MWIVAEKSLVGAKSDSPINPRPSTIMITATAGEPDFANCYIHLHLVVKAHISI